jgi:hypothetical protein
MVVNKSILHALLIVIASLALSSACKTDIKSDDGETTANANNIRVRVFAFVNGFVYNPDSLYFLGGANLKIDDISIIHSNFYFVDMGDTLDPGGVAEWRLSSGEASVFLYRLSPGSYSGFYRYLVGLDSVSNALPPGAQPSGSPLTQSLYRGPLEGYNFVTITGRVQDPGKPDSEPDIPLKWVLANADLNMTYGLGKSFNITAAKPVTFDVVLRVEDLFTGLSPLGTPTIEADPGNANDFQNAEQLRDNFIQAYNIQL